MKDRYARGELVARQGVAINLGLSALKLAIGLYTGSRSLIADGVHSATDVAGSLAVVVALRIARRRADDDHPYGHQRAESIAATVVGMLMLAAGVEICKGSVAALQATPAIPGQAWLAAAIAAASILIKEWLFRYNLRLGREIGSPAVMAAAYEHRSDVYASSAALIGISGATLGHPLLDPAAALAVGLLILKNACRVGYEGIHQLMDGFDGERLRELGSIAAAVGEVRQITQIRARQMGGAVAVDVTITVPPHLTVVDSHRVADAVERRLLAEPQVASVMVHVEPLREPEPC